MTKLNQPRVQSFDGMVRSWHLRDYMIENPSRLKAHRYNILEDCLSALDFSAPTNIRHRDVSWKIVCSMSMRPVS